MADVAASRQTSSQKAADTFVSNWSPFVLDRTATTSLTSSHWATSSTFAREHRTLQRISACSLRHSAMRLRNLNIVANPCRKKSHYKSKTDHSDQSQVCLGWQFFQRSFAVLASLTGTVISSGSWNILLAG